MEFGSFDFQQPAMLARGFETNFIPAVAAVPPGTFSMNSASTFFLTDFEINWGIVAGVFVGGIVLLVLAAGPTLSGAIQEFADTSDEELIDLIDQKYPDEELDIEKALCSGADTVGEELLRDPNAYDNVPFSELIPAVLRVATFIKLKNGIPLGDIDRTFCAEFIAKVEKAIPTITSESGTVAPATAQALEEWQEQLVAVAQAEDTDKLKELVEIGKRDFGLSAADVTAKIVALKVAQMKEENNDE